MEIGRIMYVRGHSKFEEVVTRRCSVKRSCSKNFSQIPQKNNCDCFFAEVNFDIVNMVAFGKAHLTRSLFLETFQVSVPEKDFAKCFFEEAQKKSQWLFLKKIAMMLFLILLLSLIIAARTMIVQQRPWTQAKPGSRVLVGMQLFRDGGEPWNSGNMGRITSLLEVKPRSVSFCI